MVMISKNTGLISYIYIYHFVEVYFHNYQEVFYHFAMKMDNQSLKFICDATVIGNVIQWIIYQNDISKRNKIISFICL